MKNKCISGLKKRLTAALLALAMAVALVPTYLATPASAADENTVVPDIIGDRLAIKNLKVTGWNISFDLQSPAAACNMHLAILDMGGADNVGQTRPENLESYIAALDVGNYINDNAATYPGLKDPFEPDAYHRFAVVENKDNVSTTYPITTIKPLKSFNVNEDSTDYYHRYVVVAFDTGEATAKLSGEFYVDSKGNSFTRDDSYMLRYMENKNLYTGSANQAITGMPENVIATPVTSNVNLSFADITSPGYNFLGWDANKELLGKDANAASVSMTVPNYTAIGNASFKPADKVGLAANEIADLNAIWKPIPVAISAAAKPCDDVLYAGKSMEYLAKIDGATNTQKIISGPALPEGLSYNTNLNITASGIEAPIITGTPKVPVENPTTVTVTVKDAINGTTDTLEIEIPKINEGYQAKPRMDWNTGVAVKSISADGADDGEIQGLYPKTEGALKYPDNDRNVYEYRMWNVEATIQFAAATTEQKKVDTNWTAWGTVPREDGEIIYAEGTTEDQKAPGAAKVVATASDTEFNIGMNAVSIQNLPKGDYQLRFAELAKDETNPDSVKRVASEALDIHVGLGTYVAAEGKIVFHLGDSAMSTTLPEGAAADAKTDEELFAAYLEGIKNKTEGKVIMPKQKPVREGYNFLGWTDGTKENDAYVYYNYSDIADAPQSFVTLGAAPIVLIPAWGATTTAFGVLNYYDWDGTLIGYSVMPKDISADALATSMAAFAEKYSAPSADLDVYGYKADATKPLTNKAGYKFNNVWLDAESDVFECYKNGTFSYASTSGAMKSHKLLTDYTEAEKPNATIISAALKADGTYGVKAAYEAQENLDKYLENGSVATTNDRPNFYTIDKESVECIRIGAAGANTGTYNIKFDMLRQNIDGVPVSRCALPITKAISLIDVDSPEVITRSDSVNDDRIEVSIIVAKGTGILKYNLIEAGGYAEWLNGDTVGAVQSEMNFGDETNPGFVERGTLALIHHAAKAAMNGDTAWDGIASSDFSTELNVRYNNSPINSRNLAAVKANIVAAVTDAITNHNYHKPFTKAQLQEAINNGMITFNPDNTPAV